MNGRPAHHKWVGLLLGFFLTGSAHFLAGDRKAGIAWYVLLQLVCWVAFLTMLVSGVVAYAFGVGVFIVLFVLWIIMMKQSWRPVPRMGVKGWVMLPCVVLGLNWTTSALTGLVVSSFKLPTGSMQPTLRGIQVRNVEPGEETTAGLFRRWVSGEHYRIVRAKEAGTVTLGITPSRQPVIRVGGAVHEIQREAEPRIAHGEDVERGDVLWEGIVTACDHVFADQVSYWFREPARGDLVIFTTEGLSHPQIRSRDIWIKRVAGLPGERLRIEPPFLVVNGEQVEDPPFFSRMSSESAGYGGYTLAPPGGAVQLASSSDEVTLGDGEYYLLGDNSAHSLDSRFFGPVPWENIMGRVAGVYWPFTRIGALNGE